MYYVTLNTFLVNNNTNNNIDSGRTVVLGSSCMNKGPSAGRLTENDFVNRDLQASRFDSNANGRFAGPYL